MRNWYLELELTDDSSYSEVIQAESVADVLRYVLSQDDVDQIIRVKVVPALP